jgi:hypothetical protein
MKKNCKRLVPVPLDRLVRQWRAQAGYFRASSALLIAEENPIDSARERAYAETLLTCARDLQDASSAICIKGKE